MSTSLFERLGGNSGIKAIVSDLVDNHMSNPSIATRFAKSDVAALKKTAADFMIAGTGGENNYQGMDMLTAHKGMNISAKEFMAVLDDALAALAKHNPVDRLGPLAKVDVPIFHIHGDSDKVVPLDKNSSVVKERYDNLGGTMTLEIVKGQGHNMWPGWFNSQKLVDFVITH